MDSTPSLAAATTHPGTKVARSKRQRADQGKACHKRPEARGSLDPSGGSCTAARCCSAVGTGKHFEEDTVG